MGLRGPKPRSVQEHIARGTYRPARHGPRPQSSDAENPWKTILRLPDGPPASRKLDPIEELLQREGIEIRPEDRRPKSP
jgi:hypothetical protein